jgi:CheY-like chemotaxis protein
VRGVHRGAEVLDAVFNFAPDVVLLDIGMPQMSGYEVARRLRERYGSARPALIAVTAFTRTMDRVQARAAGFEHHVGKPYEPRELLQLIGELARAAPQRDER